MGIGGVLLLTVSNVTPASSVYVVVPGIIQQAGSGALIAMGAAALISLAMAFVYAELASAFPLAGGDYAMLGRVLGPGAGFVTMGGVAITMTLSTTVLSMGASAYVTAIWPGAERVPVAIGVIAAATVLGVFNVRMNAWVTGLFLLVEVLAIVVIAGLGFAHMHRPLLELVQHPMVVGASGFEAAPVGAIGSAAAVGVFAYSGFGQAVYFSEEMHEAPRQVGSAILWALALVVMLEFAPLAGVLLGAPDLKPLLSSPSPFSDFLQDLGGQRLAATIGLGVALAISNAVIVGVLINGRLFYSTGRDQVWHGLANRALVKLHPRFNSPWVATLLAGAIGMAGCFAPQGLLLVLTGTGTVLLYGILCLGVIVGRTSGRTAHAPYRMPLFPLAPALGLIALVYILYSEWIDSKIGRPSLIVNLFIVAGALAWYLLARHRRGAEWRLAGPAE